MPRFLTEERVPGGRSPAGSVLPSHHRDLLSCIGVELARQLISQEGECEPDILAVDIRAGAALTVSKEPGAVAATRTEVGKDHRQEKQSGFRHRVPSMFA
jgi:hypothetical protein